MNELITIVTVTFNTKKYIEKTIKSIVEQTYKHIEYIIIDGASTDGTIDLIKEYEDYIDYWISEKDNGIYDAMNKAIARASGRWIYFLNSDDVFYDKNTLEILSQYLSDNIDILYGDLIYIENNKQRYLQPSGIKSIYQHPPAWHQGMIVKTDFHKNLPFDLKYKSCGDYDFMVRAYLQNAKFKYINIPFARYANNGFSNQNVLKHRLEGLEISCKLFTDSDNLLDNFFLKDFIKHHNKKYNSTLHNDIGEVQQKLDSLKQKYKKIAIYGYGNSARLFIPYLEDNFVFAIDINANNIDSKHKVIHPDNINQNTYDCVIISLIGREEAIIYTLVNRFKIRKEKIISLVENREIETETKNSIISSSICTQKQLESKRYKYWLEKLNMDPNLLHRKFWEFAFIVDSLDKIDKLKPNNIGLGFAVGNEPLASYFCSRGCKIVATDLDFESAKRQGWVDTNQHASNLEKLNSCNICDNNQFKNLCKFEFVDMNDIPTHLNDFDFVWSACALEHLGSIEAGLTFIKKSLSCLKPGGIAVHTTEYNVLSDDDTVTYGPTVIYRKRDILKLKDELEKSGYIVDELSFSSGTLPYDNYVDLPPYNQDKHLKLLLGKYVITSVGIIIQKRKEDKNAYRHGN
jgi:glycosyltransferase involved in cell wall biosynthesis